MFTFASMIKNYSGKIEKRITEMFSSFGTKKDRLRQAIEYSLSTGGKRFRPLIVLLIAKNIGKNYDVMDSALSLEFIHTATLIADDLPCMDNDDERRGKPTLHVEFDESTALLASYGLIAEGYNLLRLNYRKFLENVSLEEADIIYDYIFQQASYLTGVHGVIGGQFQDLFSENIGQKEYLDIVYKKTGALFELSFCCGWLFGGGDFNSIDIVKEAAKNFGMMFQLTDDYLDLKQDLNRCNHSGINYTALFGKEECKKAINKYADNCMDKLRKLQIDDSEFSTLIYFIKSRIN